MTPEIEEIRAKIVKLTMEVAERRDALRELKRELSDYIDSFDAGIEDLEDAARTLENATDSLSHYV